MDVLGVVQAEGETFAGSRGNDLMHHTILGSHHFGLFLVLDQCNRRRQVLVACLDLDRDHGRVTVQIGQISLVGHILQDVADRCASLDQVIPTEGQLLAHVRARAGGGDGLYKGILGVPERTVAADDVLCSADLEGRASQIAIFIDRTGHFIAMLVRSHEAGQGQAGLDQLDPAHDRLVGDLDLNLIGLSGLITSVADEDCQLVSTDQIAFGSDNLFDEVVAPVDHFGQGHRTCWWGYCSLQTCR